MTGFLRFVGLLNAAVWCGSAIFLAIGLPALFTPEMKRILNPAGVGYAAESIVARYFIVQYWCGGIAVAHLVAEWFYYGRPLRRLNFGVAVFVWLLGLIGGGWVQPKMRALHFVEYFGKSSEQQAHAARVFANWHAASMTANLLVIVSLVWYLMSVTREQEPDRFVSFSKMRG